ncbi:conserved protein of unknown function [Candidatus Hydrogenisulfobacillus filiaventi]|uniref:Uncharacterized protein n=1 Tax=Candidatus Hydrogenisulfobacillus filiaventi TaxID=2707344 RepID=A0A6F8ZDS2_9FIRM|nr:hypothetical protein [Bacillota bacterium]CAB1127759.1 conserved protein of unknown function [Candidatus Hydrogenisulfobacillus filiaventi]
MQPFSRRREGGPGPALLMLGAALALMFWGYLAAPAPAPIRVLAAGPHGRWLLTRRSARITTFRVPARRPRPLQGNTSLVLAPYPGWEANGSAGADGRVRVAGGFLRVGVAHPHARFRGFFLTATHALPPAYTFEAWATPPPPVRQGVGELVFALQTASTTRTGLINYVWVAQLVTPRGRWWEAGDARGRIRNAHERRLAKVAVARFPPPAGVLNRLAIRTDGRHRLSVYVNGRCLLRARGLHLAVTPPFEPYLEVQARGTAYAVAYARYAAVQGRTVRLVGLPPGTRVRAGGRRLTVERRQVVIPRPARDGPLTVTVQVPGGRPHRLRLWPGDRVRYAPGGRTA